MVYSNGMKDSHSKKLWFKRRRYGWGWVPVTWQGILVVALFVSVVITAAFQLPENEADVTTEQLAMFFGVFAVGLFGLILAGIIKGPKPRWRWGKKPGDNPNEDF